ncbi:MAG: T9SS type A sorting domain-containing protein [Flavipsychrobacter sp.]|nr:T9SS type A sorting domain-containing protein [Flavipsychrobacter sp.]
MKKRILLFTTSIVLLSGAIMSYNAGPVTSGLGNRTGSQGSIANCAGGGCHASNNSATFLSVTLGDSVTGLPINGGWQHDKTYKVTVGGTSAGKTKYGFQLSAVYFDGSAEVQAGTFTIISGTDVSVKPSGNLSIVEHNQKLNMNLGAYAYTVYWKAPPTGAMDSVRFYATANCVNDDGSTAGDQPNSIRQAYHRQTTSVAEVNANIRLSAFPSPLTNQLTIAMEGAEKGQYTINVFDATGKVISTQTEQVSGNYSTTLNTASWAAGMYHVQVKHGAAQKTIAVVK